MDVELANLIPPKLPPTSVFDSDYAPRYPSFIYLGFLTFKRPARYHRLDKSSPSTTAPRLPAFSKTVNTYE